MSQQNSFIDILCNIIEENNKYKDYIDKGEIYENILTNTFRKGVMDLFEGCLIPARFHNYSQSNWSRVFNDGRILLLGSDKSKKKSYSSFICFYTILSSLNYPFGIGSFLKNVGFLEPIRIYFNEKKLEITIFNKVRNNYFTTAINRSKFERLVVLAEPLFNFIIDNIHKNKNEDNIFSNVIYSFDGVEYNKIEEIKNNLQLIHEELLFNICNEIESIDSVIKYKDVDYFNISEKELKQFTTLLCALAYFSKKSNIKNHYYFTSYAPQYQKEIVLSPGNLTFSLKKEMTINEIDFFYVFSSVLWSNISFSDFQHLTQQIERQDVFGSLYHSQKQYLDALSKLKEQLNDKQKEWLNYINDCLYGFLEVTKLHKDGTLKDWQPEHVKISNIINELVVLFRELILTDEKIIGTSIKTTAELKINSLMSLNDKNLLFTGNFEKFETSNLNIPLMPLNLILKESIVNAIENADAHYPQINIELSEGKDKVCIKITNNRGANLRQVDEMQGKGISNRYGCTMIRTICDTFDWIYNPDSDHKNFTWYYFEFKNK